MIRAKRKEWANAVKRARRDELAVAREADGVVVSDEYSDEDAHTVSSPPKKRPKGRCRKAVVVASPQKQVRDDTVLDASSGGVDTASSVSSSPESESPTSSVYSSPPPYSKRAFHLKVKRRHLRRHRRHKRKNGSKTAYSKYKKPLCVAMLGLKIIVILLTTVI